MQRVIDGLKYDTDTADCVHEWENHYGGNDFHYCEEALYKTTNGRWFLAGEGGPLSKYAEPSGSNGHCGGSGLSPVTADEAQAWLEAHGAPAEVISEHFDVQPA